MYVVFAFDKNQLKRVTYSYRGRGLAVCGPLVRGRAAGAVVVDGDGGGDGAEGRQPDIT